MVRALFAQSATRSELGEKYAFARITIRTFRRNYCVWLARFYSWRTGGRANVLVYVE
jgi:hypothetical protein